MLPSSYLSLWLVYCVFAEATKEVHGRHAALGLRRGGLLAEGTSSTSKELVTVTGAPCGLEVAGFSVSEGSAFSGVGLSLLGVG